MVEACILKYLLHIKIKKSSLFFLFLFFISLSLLSQNKEIDDLKKLRSQYESDILNAKKLLEKKSKTKSNYLNDLKILSSKIQSQENIISTYKQEILLISQELDINNQLITKLSDEIDNIKKVYELLIIEANKQYINNQSELMFIFSAKSFSEAYRRFNVLKQYSAYRKTQGIILLQTKAKYDSIKQHNLYILSQKQKVYNSLNKELEDIKLAVDLKENYISKLKKDENWLKREISKKKKASSDLENSIKKLISDLGKASNANLFSNFSNSKGKLNWPIEGGVVINNFGEHNHAVLKGVKIKNNGIDISALKDNEVKSVYEGTVSRVIAIPGYNKAVIIRHGKFLTVYANLADVFVKNGDIIKSSQGIGKIYSETNDKNGILHFEIWEENKKINPTDWLTKFN